MEMSSAHADDFQDFMDEEYRDSFFGTPETDNLSHMSGGSYFGRSPRFRDRFRGKPIVEFRSLPANEVYLKRSPAYSFGNAKVEKFHPVHKSGMHESGPNTFNLPSLIGLESHAYRRSPAYGFALKPRFQKRGLVQPDYYTLPESHVYMKKSPIYTFRKSKRERLNPGNIIDGEHQFSSASSCESLIYENDYYYDDSAETESFTAELSDSTDDISLNEEVICQESWMTQGMWPPTSQTSLGTAEYHMSPCIDVKFRSVPSCTFGQRFPERQNLSPAPNRHLLPSPFATKTQAYRNSAPITSFGYKPRFQDHFSGQTTVDYHELPDVNAYLNRSPSFSFGKAKLARVPSTEF